MGLISGNKIVGNQHRFPNLVSRSSTCSSVASFEENQLPFDLGRSSAELQSGITMKKLLADEMTKETESGRRSPSIIARLMGLDGLPAPLNTNKKQKRLSDSHQRGSSSSGFQKNIKPHDNRSHRKNGTGQQQFKDVYEVVGRSNVETRNNTSHSSSNRISSEDEIRFIRQKFMDVKRFSTDEKLQHSKEFHDAIELLDSNRDLLLKFLQEPDSMFSKHLHDLHNVPESYYGCMLGMNSKNALKCNIDAIGSQTGGEASQKIDISHSQKHWGSCNHDVYDRHSADLHKSNFSVERDEESSSIATKIVVLKPHLGKALNIPKPASSTSPCEPQSDFELYNECSNLKHLGPEVRGKRSKHDDVYGRKSRESRELAREITRRMRDRLGVDSFNVSSSGYKGYSADESSHDTSENDSSESEVSFVSSRTLSNRTRHKKVSTLRYRESSVNVEGKKRLSERWKITHRSEELGASSSSKGSTLGEMLAIPDVDIRPQSFDTTVARDECIRRFGRNDGIEKLTNPLGISSRDGWKDECIQKLPRSRSLPASVNHLGNPKSSTKCEAITAERFLVRKESIGFVRNKGIKREIRRKDGSILESKKPSVEKSQSCAVRAEIFDDVHESENMMKNSSDGKDSPDVKAVILEMPSCRDDTRVSHNLEVDSKHGNVFRSLNCPDEPILVQKIPSCILPQDGASTSDVPFLPQVGGSSCLQCAATHAESSASSKESEQPSPVSVLEPPFVEDISSGSECFERVSAELHGLRKQLQLLKLESEVYDEGSIVLSSDEYGEESTEMHRIEHFPPVVGECWESWYLVDVLTLSGLDKTDCELFLGTWHSPDCPIGLWVFEDLEKRYGELESCLRSERRILFDHINFRVVEISQQFVDMEPWVKKPRKNISPQWLKDVLKAELHKLLEKHENKTAENDMVILNDMQWMKLGEHMSAVGRADRKSVV